MIIMSWNGFPTIFLPSKRARERGPWLGPDISSLNRIMKRTNTGGTRWRGLSKRVSGVAEHYSAWKRLTKRQDGGAALPEGDENQQVLHNKWLKLGYVTG